MTSIFEVTDAASPNVILTTAEAKAALGVTGSSRDADIDRLVSRISAAIFKACKLRVDGINPPSLLSEEIIETFRLDCSKRGPLMLSRRRVSDVTTLTEGTAELTEDTDFTIDRASGLLNRLGSTDAFTCWPQGKIVVEYVAGFSAIPDDLKLAAELWLRSLWRTDYGTPEQLSDPFTKREEIPGVRTLERWLPQMNNSAPSSVPPEVEMILYDGGYIETWVA